MIGGQDSTNLRRSGKGASVGLNWDFWMLPPDEAARKCRFLGVLVAIGLAWCHDPISNRPANVSAALAASHG